MQNTLKIAEKVNQDYHNFCYNQNFNDGIDPAYRKIFYPRLNYLISYYKDLIDKINKSYNGDGSFPMRTDPMEDY